MSEYLGVWVLAEHDNEVLRDVSLELLGIGRTLADKLEQKLSGIILGYQISDLAETLIEYGADQVYTIEERHLESYDTDIYTHALTESILKYKPLIVLYGATIKGRDLAPRVAARLDTGLTADCTGLEINENKQLLQIRPAFGGKLMAKIICPTARPQMATVRPNVMKKRAPDKSRKRIIKQINLDLKTEKRIKLLESVVEVNKNIIKIEEAEIIVSTGKGIKAEKNLKIIEEFAHLLKAAFGGSRKVIDSGWMPHHQQVGQTGKTVAPKIYIAVGISGAIQHLVGMQSSDTIIAINNDPEAPIFNIASFGIVGDLFEIIPAIKKELNKHMIKE